MRDFFVLTPAMMHLPSIKILGLVLTLSVSSALNAATSQSTSTVNQVSQAMLDLQMLAGAEMQGRGIGSEGSAKARAYIIKRIEELGLKPCAKDFIAEFSFSDRSGSEKIGQNIVACQQGQLNTADVLVVSAHYDHLGIQNQKTYFGADDNASGVAGVLAVASHFKKNVPRNNIAYVFFDGEEIGLRGAQAFVKQQTIASSKIVANINFDMIARGDKNELFASGSYQTPSFKTTLSSLDGTGGIKLKFDHDKPEQGQDDWTNQSDHFAFYNAGVPHLYFGVEDHADYHKPSDTADKVNPVFFNAAIEIVQRAVSAIDKASEQIDFRAERKKYIKKN